MPSKGSIVSRWVVVGVVAAWFGASTAGPQLLKADGLPLLQLSNLAYRGAFRTPTGPVGASSFDWGYSIMAFNPARNSLYVSGHDWHQMVAEISIPSPVSSSSVSDLPVAGVLQPFSDPTDGTRSSVDGGDIKLGGFMVSGGQLYGTVYSYYDADGSQTQSHYKRSLTLSQTGSLRGMYQVGSGGAGRVGGWMLPIPAGWQAAFGAPALTGLCCVPIVSRTSYGPALFAFDPAHVGQVTPVPATTLLNYPADHPLMNDWDVTSTVWNASTAIRGAAFPDGTASVLFFGRQGVGNFCYGEASACGDPEQIYKGNHAYPYEYQIWAYSAHDLLAVKNGQKQSWELRPYAIWPLTLPFEARETVLGGVAYDPQTQRIFVAQLFANGDYPVIHVFGVSAAVVAPAPPPNVRIVQ